MTTRDGCGGQGGPCGASEAPGGGGTKLGQGREDRGLPREASLHMQEPQNQPREEEQALLLVRCQAGRGPTEQVARHSRGGVPVTLARESAASASSRAAKGKLAAVWGQGGPSALVLPREELLQVLRGRYVIRSFCLRVTGAPPQEPCPSLLQ